MTEERRKDQESDLLDLLRNALIGLPVDAGSAPPSHVLAGAGWVHEWVTMEAELAELTFDSAESPEMAGVRSAGSLRELTFVSGRHTIELEIEHAPASVTVSGSIDPPGGGKLQLIIGGELFAAELDGSGAFSISNVIAGTALAFLDGPSGTIRLGSFEI